MSKIEKVAGVAEEYPEVSLHGSEDIEIRETTLEIRGKKITYLEFIPQTETNHPVIFGHGWGVVPNSYYEYLNKLCVDNQSRVLAPQIPTGIDIDKLEQSEEIGPEVELRKACALLEFMEQAGLNQADLIGHSEGGLYMTIFAILYPEKVRNLVLLNSSGLLKTDSFPNLVGRFSLELLKQIIYEIREGKNLDWLNVLKTIIKHNVLNPLQSLKQALACSSQKILESLRELSGRGIGVALGIADDDLVIKKEKIDLQPGDEESFVLVKHAGAHYDINLHPEKMIEVTEEALKLLREKRV